MGDLRWREMPAELSPALRCQVEAGVAVLRRGGVVAFPTDTIYGLGAAADIAPAVARVYELKKRPLSQPLPLLLGAPAQLVGITNSVSPLAQSLAESFWPGALTLVLPRSRAVLDIITAGGDTVAVRVPAHPLALALINGLGVPVVGTSANLSGWPSTRTADEVRAQFGEKLEMVIDSGRAPGGRESTIIDLIGPVPVVRRAGAISLDEIRRVAGKVIAPGGN